MTWHKAGPNRGNAGKGRPKGSRNRTTAAAKAIIEDAVEGLGGADRLLAWAKESPDNERVLWSSIFPKLLPLQITGKDEGALEVTHRAVILPEKRMAEVSVRPLRPPAGNPSGRLHGAWNGGTTAWVPLLAHRAAGTIPRVGHRVIATAWVDIWVDARRLGGKFMHLYQCNTKE